MFESDRKISREEILKKKTARGGWLKADLAEWGVPWPPPKGWLRALTEGHIELWEIYVWEP